ncbi:hypothetical protein SNC94_07805, partial [Escherichia coli]|nr:hypothetical protein [Escherichia coli]
GGTADRNRSHWSTSKTPSYTKSVSWQHHLSSDVKTVLAVSDSKNLNKIKMVHPDIILSPQLFGSEILARVLNGEEINNDMLVSMLLNSGHGIFSDNDELETKADSKESAQK